MEDQSNQKSPAQLLLEATAFDTDIPNPQFLELVKASTDLAELERRWDVPARSIRQHAADICVAMRIVANKNAKSGGQKNSLLKIYKENGFSVRAVYRATGISYPEIRKRLIAETNRTHEFLFRGKDWNVGRKKRARFDLFEWIKQVHKHFSLRVLCESINWSPKAVLDLCHKCNEAGYAVIAPKIVGADLEWLSLYDPNLGSHSFKGARDQKAPKKRGGKEIFKRLLHQENPTKSVRYKLGKRTKNKRNAIRGQGGLVARRGGKVKRAPNLWGKMSGSERNAIQAYLNS